MRTLEVKRSAPYNPANQLQYVQEANAMGWRPLGVLVVSVFFSAISLSAHHAFSAEFDAKMPVKLEGTVTRIEMVNPHGWIYIDVKGADGKVVNWAIETGGPNALARRGVKKGFLPIGQVVVVTGYRAKDMSMTAAGDQVRFLDGRSFSVGGSAGEGFPGAKP